MAYFPRTYFAPTYFAPTYFPSGPGAPPEPVPEVDGRPDHRRATSDADPLEVVAGADEAWTIQLRDRQGSPLAGYTTANTLTASMWEGEDRSPVSPGVTVAWAGDGSDGRIILTCPRAATLSLAPGEYEGLVEVQSGAIRYAAWLGRIAVVGRPGSAAGPYTLCTYATMRMLYPAIERMQVDDADLAGFGRQRALATSDFLKWIIDRYDPRPGFTRRVSGTYDPSGGWEVQDFATPPPTRAEIRDRLEAGGLVLPGPDAATAGAIVARVAISYVLERQPSDPRGAYATDAAGMLERARADFAMYRAFVDLDDDGAADVLIDRDCTYLEPLP